MITFAIFVWFTMKFVWPALEKIMKERQAKIAEGLYAAERGHKELELAQKEAIKELREAREQATHTIEQARKQSALIVEQAKRDAEKEKEKILALGRSELEEEQHKVRVKLRQEVVNLAILAAEKILKRTVTDLDQKALLDIEEEAGSYG